MNKRIQDLAEQAGWDMGDEVEGFNTRLEKFAELLVQEVCWDMINSHLDKTKVNRVAKHWGIDIGVEE